MRLAEACIVEGARIILFNLLLVTLTSAPLTHLTHRRTWVHSCPITHQRRPLTSIHEQITIWWHRVGHRGHVWRHRVGPGWGHPWHHGLHLAQSQRGHRATQFQTKYLGRVWVRRVVNEAPRGCLHSGVRGFLVRRGRGHLRRYGRRHVRRLLLRLRRKGREHLHVALATVWPDRRCGRERYNCARHRIQK